MDNFLNIAPKCAQRGDFFKDAEGYSYHVKVCYPSGNGQFSQHRPAARAARKRSNVSLSFLILFSTLRPRTFVEIKYRARPREKFV